MFIENENTQKKKEVSLLSQVFVYKKKKGKTVEIINRFHKS